MKLLLCSNFNYLAEKYLPKFFDLKKKHTALLVGYASEDGDFFCESHTKILEDLNFKVLHLLEDYKFDDDLDLIYIKGGNTAQLMYYLKKFNQFEKIKKLVESGVCYAGQSAGSVLAGNDIEWTLRSEPFKIDLKKEFGQDAYHGLNFVDEKVFVHCSRYRFPVYDEIQNAKTKEFRVSNEWFFKDYLKDRKIYKNDKFLVIKDNQAYFVNDKERKMLTFNWSKYPIKNEYKLF